MLTVESGSARLVVAPEHGGRIEHLTVHGRELLVTSDIDAHDYGCFPMAPWAGRIRHGRFRFDGEEYRLPLNKPPHAIHGTARDHPWQVDDDAQISTELGESWPFGGRVVQRYELCDDALRLTMEVHAGHRAMPVSCGWHPWWNRHAADRPLELELHAGASYVKDAEEIPTGELGPLPPHPWDDCFTQLADPPAVLRWPGALELTLTTSCACVVAYDAPAHAICLEPQTAPPDAFTLAPTVVGPGSALVATATWRWRPTD